MLTSILRSFGRRPQSLAIASVVLLAGCESTNVVPVDVATVEVEPNQTVMLVGQTQAFQAIPRAAGGQRLTGRSVQWQSADGSKARVTGAGEVEATGEGSVTISAVVEGVRGESAVSILPGPEIVLNPSFLVFQAEVGDDSDDEKMVSVTNGGEGRVDGLQRSIRYLQGANADWLGQTTLNRGTAPATLVVRISSGSLSEGEYSAEIDVISTSAINSPQTLLVTLVVGEAQPAIQLSQTSATFSIPRLFPTPVAHAPISITNGGGGELKDLSTETIYQGGTAGWLSAVLDDEDAPTQLRLFASAGILPKGEYRATVRISSPDASESRAIEVTLTIT